jgi:Flp pilus assembly protein TadD
MSLLLAAAVLLVFGRSWHSDFVNYDDNVYVAENGEVQRGLSGRSLRWALTSTEAANWHPLSWWSLQLDWRLYARNAGGFHLTSVLLHAASTALLFLFLREVTGAVWRSALVAALFALHPLHVESVAWISERKDVLSGFFGTLSLWCYGRYARSPGLARYLAVCGALVLGLLAKPMLVTLPCVMLLLDYWPLRRLSGWRVWLEKVPLAAPAAISAVITVIVQQHGGAVKSLAQYPFGVRLANALVSYVAYIGKALWPTGLAVYYPYRNPAVLPVEGAVAGVVLAAITLLALLLRCSRPYLLVGWLWYLVMLLPVIGLVQVSDQAMADRYTYLPMIGVFVMAVWGLADAAGRLRVPGRLTGAVACAAVAGCAVLSVGQVGYWWDSIRLWKRTIEVTPANALAHHNLGVALGTAGQLDAAMMEYRQALAIKPDYAGAHHSLGLALAKKGDFVAAEPECAEAVRLDPADARSHYDLGMMRYLRGRLAESVPEFRETLRLRPDFFPALSPLGRARIMLGQRSEAEQCFREALRWQPSSSQHHRDLAHALFAGHDEQRARAEYRVSLELDPGWRQTEEQLAWRLAASENALAALALFLSQQVCEAGAPSARQVDTLGAAYAAVGQFSQAEDAARRALTLVPAGDTAHAEEIRARLRLYGARQRYRQTGNADDKAGGS